MGLIKTKEEIEILTEAGFRLAGIVKILAEKVTPGVSTKELDNLAEKLVRDGGDIPSFKGYRPGGAKESYPATLCTSVNDAVVHGVPTDEPLKNGDIIGLDIGLTHRGLIADMAVTVPVGEISEEYKKLITITKESLMHGIKAAVSGNNIGAIGHAIESYVHPFGYGIVEVLGGHGVGHKVHEPPFIPNYGNKTAGPVIQEGMVLALEPMLNLGSPEISLDSDGFTYRTRDGAHSAHFEHTIVITKDGPVILTRL